MATQSLSPAETQTERAARLLREQTLIARGAAEIASGAGIELESWLDALERDPAPGLPSAAR